MRPRVGLAWWIVTLVVTASTLEAQTTVIRAGTLIDPETGTALRDQTIIVEGAKIRAVGPALPVPSGARLLDLSKATVMPGLFDAHTHLCMTVNMRRDAGRYYYTTLNDPDSFRAVQGVVNARSMLRAGFTTVRDVGNEGNFACSSVRTAVAQGLVEGPTIINAGRIIAPYGGQFKLQPDKREVLATPEYFFADTRDELLKAVRQNIHYGAGVIKLVVDDQEYIYSPEDIRFVVDEATKAGVKVAAHAWTGPGAHNAVLGGVASLEHLNGIADGDLELAKQKGVIAVFTPYPAWVLKTFQTEEQAAAEYKDEVDRLKAANRIGVTIAFGTDAIHDLPGYSRGSLAVTFVDSYLDAGLTAKTILQAMTVNAARLLGVEKERGAIKPGLAADIIALPGNPLDDPRLLRQVNFVMKNGIAVR